MAITNELKTLNKLEAVGFTHEQSKVVVEAIEEGVQSGFDRFVEVLEQRFADFETRIQTQIREMETRLQTQMREIDARLRLEIQTLRTDMHAMRADLLKEQRDQMLRFAALVTLIVAVIGGVYRFF